MSGDEIIKTKKQDDQLLDYLGKVFFVHDNFFNILLLSDENFSLLRNSLDNNPSYPENPTREQLVAEKTTSMLFQLSVGYLYNLTEIINFLKNNSYCNDLFESNKIYDEFKSNTRLICELRNNIVFHGSVLGNNFRGIQHVLSTLNISRDESIKQIWISLRCGLELTNQILFKFSHMEIEKNIISKSMYSNDTLDIIQNYFNAKTEFDKLSFE